ncbi:hypothetical protein MPSEU_000800000 [Mayamaea pseudoterrestris]|nr:hypothetical protein MPSEU_000800000 [Mayamaea pseudoterrestris]
MVRIHRSARSALFSTSLSSNLKRSGSLILMTLGLLIVYLTFQSSNSSIHSSSGTGGTRRGMASAHSANKIINTNRPYLVYGTAWKKERTAELVYQAVKTGFRFIDTACQPKHYHEPGVGQGWKSAANELNLDRSDLFLQTKFTSVDGQDPNNIPYNQHATLEDQVKTSLQVSLRNLQTDYLDSLVLHSPMQTLEDTMLVWRTMESFVDQGTVRNIGISNCYDANLFKTLYEMARIKPWVLQNRFYADSNFDVDLRVFLKAKGIKYQSFWTLSANRHALATRQAKEMAAAKMLSPQTLLYAFLMQLGYVTPLDGTTSLEHMMEDVAVMERMEGGEKFLSEQEMRDFGQILGLPDNEPF